MYCGKRCQESVLLLLILQFLHLYSLFSVAILRFRLVYHLGSGSGARGMDLSWVGIHGVETCLACPEGSHADQRCVNLFPSLSGFYKLSLPLCTYFLRSRAVVGSDVMGFGK